MDDASKFHQILAVYGGKPGKASRKLLSLLKDKGLTDEAIAHYSAYVLKNPVGVVIWFYGEAGVLETNADDYFPIALRNGLLAIGSCPNGDQLVIDIRDQLGAVGYLDHETMWQAANVRERLVVLAPSLGQYAQGLHDKAMPLDYYEARDRRK